MTINTVTSTPNRIKSCIHRQLKSKKLRHKAAYIWGKPGIGKSQIVAQIAAEMNLKLFDVRLTTKDSTDLTGLPYLNEETRRTIYYIPEFFPTEEDLEKEGYDGGLVFLDELSAAELRLQAASYELCLDRRVGKYNLPDNVMVIAAGNRVEDGAIAYELTSALADRFIHYLCVPSVKDFLLWAEDNNIHTSVKTMVKTKPDHLDGGFENIADTDNSIVPSPRSWATVSDMMYEMEGEPDLLKVMVPGIIGTASAQEFFFVTEELSKLAPMEDYINKALAKDKRGLIEILPNELPGLYGLGYSLPAYCETEEDYVAACYIFNVLGNIADNLPRKEIMSNAMTTLFDRAHKLGNSEIARQVRRSDAYREMRKSMKSFAEIDRYKKDHQDD